MDIAEAIRLRQEAAKRVLARRRADRGPGDSEFAPPRDIGEWCDDAIAYLPAVRPYAALAHILEKARLGEDAALAAVRSAAALGAQEQYDLHETLAGLAADALPEAQQAAAAIQGEWRRLGLRTTRPEPQQAAEPGAR